MAGNWRRREPSLWEAMRATEPCPARLHRPEERDLFTTANLFCRSGNRRNLGRRIILPDSAARALSTELQAFPPGGIRTRVLVVKSEVPDLFTTARQSGMSGNRRERSGGSTSRKACPLAWTRPEPASRRPSRGRLHGTLMVSAGTADSGAVLERRNRTLHHRQVVSRGTGDAALFCRRNPRLHHLELENESPLFPNLVSFFGEARVEAGNRNPSGAWAREGFDQIELGKSVSSSCPREKARARPTAQIIRSLGIPLRDEWRGAHHQLSRLLQRPSLATGAVYDWRSWRGQGARYKVFDHAQWRSRRVLRTRMLRLVDADLGAARQCQRRETAPSLFGDG